MPRFNPITDIPDLTGRVAIVTGANSGLGYQTVLQLANHGAKVYLTTRSEGKARDAIARLEGESPALRGSGRLQSLVLDLSLVVNAKAAAEEFLRREERLDILINNAGQLASDFEVSSEGLSTVFAADHVAPFVFTTTLLPLMEATAKLPGADVRIITVSSSQHPNALPTTKFDSFEDLRDKQCTSDAKVNGQTGKFARYGHAKLANILFAKELQRRLDAAGVPILSISLHPGNVATEGAERLVRSMGSGALGSVAWSAITVFVMTPLQGATTQLFAATSPEVRAEAGKYGGQYLVPYGCVAKPSEVGRRPQLPGQLWELTERAVAEILQNGTV
ncbi:NAD-P-binding protein [Calocera viscosa TUFC12733]|uniref:NAD-P-binding protein n=1 Tax=Calocera viscosa (strain TUFC12733) TaxID=1330018 RepID=A0A167HRI5_CALVF|nr:NAD-P-binding protein [Calocera viscosa TUFC12733]